MTQTDNSTNGTCACGCGEPVTPGATFRHGHWGRIEPSGADSPNWKGGRTLSSRGYVLIFNPGWRTNGRPKYIQEHRLVAEKMLGRPLRPEEVVHHRDGDKTNNDSSNLEVMDQGTHARGHLRIKAWSRKYPACVVCGSTERPHQGHGLCRLCGNRRRNGITNFSPRVTGHWATHYDACASCGTTELPHAARGLCTRCYERSRHRTYPPKSRRRAR